MNTSGVSGSSTEEPNPDELLPDVKKTMKWAAEKEAIPDGETLKVTVSGEAAQTLQEEDSFIGTDQSSTATPERAMPRKRSTTGFDEQQIATAGGSTAKPTTSKLTIDDERLPTVSPAVQEVEDEGISAEKHAKESAANVLLLHETLFVFFTLSWAVTVLRVA